MQHGLSGHHSSGGAQTAPAQAGGINLAGVVECHWLSTAPGTLNGFWPPSTEQGSPYLCSPGIRSHYLLEQRD